MQQQSSGGLLSNIVISQGLAREKHGWEPPSIRAPLLRAAGWAVDATPTFSNRKWWLRRCSIFFNKGAAAEFITNTYNWVVQESRREEWTLSALQDWYSKDDRLEGEGDDGLQMLALLMGVIRQSIKYWPALQAELQRRYDSRNLEFPKPKSEEDIKAAWNKKQKELLGSDDDDDADDEGEEGGSDDDDEEEDQEDDDAPKSKKPTGRGTKVRTC
jgi:hypothetical protein